MKEKKYFGSHGGIIVVKDDQPFDFVILLQQKTSADDVQRLQELNVEDNTSDDMNNKNNDKTDAKDDNLENAKVELEEVKVHKSVMSSISPYFATMLKSDMTEKYNNKVDLSHLDAVAVKLVIDFIYGGEIVISKQNVKDILYLSDYMQLPELKSCCENFLERIIDGDNCISLYNMSKMYNLLGLWRVVPCQICKQLSSGFDNFVNEDFLQLSFEQVMGLLICPYDKMLDISVLYRASIRWIKHDVIARVAHLNDLMHKIDFKKLKQKYLSDVIADEDLIQRSLPCLRLVVDANKFHLSDVTRCKENKKLSLQKKLIDEYQNLEVVDGKDHSAKGPHYILGKSWYIKWKDYVTNNGHGWESNMTCVEWHCSSSPGPLPFIGVEDKSPHLGGRFAYLRKGVQYVNEQHWNILIERYGFSSIKFNDGELVQN